MSDSDKQKPDPVPASSTPPTNPKFQVPMEFTQQLDQQSDDNTDSAMNVVLGSMARNMFSAMQQNQQQRIYASAQKSLMLLKMKTCPVKDRKGYLCGEPCVYDTKTQSMSDFCRSHKYAHTKKRELEQLKRRVQVFEQYEVDADADDEDQDDDDFVVSNDSLQPWSKQKLSKKNTLSFTCKQPKIRRVDLTEQTPQPTVSSPTSSPPSSSARTDKKAPVASTPIYDAITAIQQQPQPQPQPQGQVPTSLTTSLLNDGIKHINLDQENMTDDENIASDEPAKNTN